ncbi:uncharacterized protein LOC117303616 [Asterias rubens]|nr:uncharacterized protein LOC117303616 [Asterias rubens]
MNHCFGHKTQEDELVKTFLQFIPDHEKKIIEQALTDFQSVSEDDEFLDMLDSHEVKPCVREDNFKTILSEVAHKELIQDTAYISDCWRVPLKQRLTQLLPKGGLDELYNKLKPTPHKVTSILQFEEHLERKEQSISTFLKKYIRQCPEERLLRFLRFCTGADVLIASSIKVRFVEPLSDFSRTPVAHTCGYVLEFPNSYGSYLELAEELTELLDSKVWVMDIV